MTGVLYTTSCHARSFGHLRILSDLPAFLVGCGCAELWPTQWIGPFPGTGSLLWTHRFDALLGVTVSAVGIYETRMVSSAETTCAFRADPVNMASAAPAFCIRWYPVFKKGWSIAARSPAADKHGCRGTRALGWTVVRKKASRGGRSPRLSTLLFSCCPARKQSLSGKSCRLAIGIA